MERQTSSHYQSISREFGGGFGANHHLRQILTAVNMPVVQQPEAYISNSAKLLDDEGQINNEETIKFLQSFGGCLCRIN